MPSTLSRRSFLRTTAAAAALTLPAAAQVQGANERLQVGLIGTGGRCRHLMGALARVANTRMAALSDVYEPNMDQARSSLTQEQPPIAIFAACSTTKRSTPS